MAASELEFAVLGPVEVRRLGEPLSLRGTRTRQLLAYLLLRPNTSVPADELRAAVWEDTHLRNQANVLQACVSRLRLIVGSDRLQTTASGYRLKLSRGELDSETFEQLVRAGREALAADEAARAEGLLSQALALWRGAAYEDLTLGRPLESERCRLEELRIAALESRIESALRLGAGSELVAELTVLAELHPFREHLQAQLAIAMYRAGRQVDALEICRAAMRALRDELGLEPTLELRDLERSILRQDPSLGASTSRGLPLSVGPLLGRTRELKEATRLMRRPDVRLMTVTGPGGIGKSRLAVEVARILGRAIFVDLTATDDASLVVAAIASAAAVARSPGQTLSDAVERHLRDRETLLVLDSFEHVIEAAPSVAHLLAAVPDLKVIVTSRTVLRLGAEHVFPVDSLAETDAVRLFRMSAQRSDSTYRDDDPEGVAKICRRLDGIPLAIELAAARAKLFQPSLMVKRLARGLDLLTDGRRDAPARQRTLRATLDWSYALLGPEERSAFHDLSVFAGGFELEAAEAVCDGTGTVDRIASLVDKSLVQRQKPDRMQLLDTVHEYAHERLVENPASDYRARERHAEYYTSLVEKVDSVLLGPDQKQSLARLEQEHGNIRAAFAFALTTRRAEVLLRLAVGCRRFWHYRGHLAEGLESLTAALAVGGPADELRARALNGSGILAAELGDYALARRRFDECADVAERIGHSGLRADALGNMGRLALFEDDHRRAEMLLDEALEADGNGDYERVVSLENLAVIALSQGDLDRAFDRAEAASTLARSSGSAHLLAASTRTFGRVLLERGELARAGELLSESLRLERELDDPQGMADCTEALGELAAARGEGNSAAILFGAASALRASVGAVRSPELRDTYSRYRALARESVGIALFDDEFARGAGLLLSDALATAERDGRVPAGS
jgi:predicted ATPase/DNA-binding SARP family transcriptional activator